MVAPDRPPLSNLAYFTVSLRQDGFTTASAGATHEFACVCPGPSLTAPDGRYHVAHPFKSGFPPRKFPMLLFFLVPQDFAVTF